MGVETSKGISNQNTSLRGTSGPIEPGSASFSKLVETWEGPTAHWATPVKLARCAVTVLGI
jgi:hypothetical protein